MVVIQIKVGSGDDTFLYETTCDTSNDAMIRDVAAVWNMRLRLRQLCGALGDLSKYGPMKPPDAAGLDSIDEDYKGMSVEKGAYYQMDPTGMRTGNGPGPQLAGTMERVAMDAEAALSKDNVARKLAVDLSMLQEKMDNIRGAVTMAYPMGLPEYDTVRMTIEGEHGLDGTAAGVELLDPATAELWVAARPFERGQTVGERLGCRNEKTKVIGKLQKPGAGAPGREAAVSEEERKAMMAFYFKKQEEMKKLAESSEDEYLHSSWADPKALQRSLRGQGAVRAPGL